MIELGIAPTIIQPVILEHYPKPLHALNGDRTLLQRTTTRSTQVASICDPLVICSEAHRLAVQAQLSRAGATARAILLQSKARGSAPALTLAAVHAVTADDPVLLAMPSEHCIADDEAFQRTVERGAALAQQGFIVTFGLPPVTPETGYGYIRAGQPLASGAAYVEAFVEKPDAAAAREYFASGRFLWNSGIFAVRASVWLEAISLYRSDIFSACERAYRQGSREGSLLRLDPAAFEACPSDSIHRAVMERVAKESGLLQTVVVTLDAGVDKSASLARYQNR